MSQHANEANHHGKEPQSKSAMTASFWLVIILVLLLVAAMNFIEVMGSSEHEGHGEGAKTEAVEHGGHEGHEAAATHEEKHEAAATETAAPAAAADSAHAEGHH